MGSNREKKQKALELRRDGWSYAQIMRELNLPSKGTLSFWFRGLALSPESKEKLRKNTQQAHERGLFNANKRKKERVEKENADALKNGRAFIAQTTQNKKDLALIAAALYWGEGTKYYDPRSPALELANADGAMIRVYMRFIRDVLEVSDDRIRFKIFTHPGVETDKALSYWEEVVKVSKDRISCIELVSRASKRRRSRRSLPWGTMSVKINDRKLYHFMKGMMEQLAADFG